MKLKPRAILFDMDGVLIDSLESWLSSLNAALKYLDYKEITREDFVKKYWGHDLYDNLEKMGLSREIGVFCNDVYSNHLDSVRIYPDTKNTLQKLSGYKKGIITNTPKVCAYEIMKQFDLEKYFDVVITSDDVNKAKPDPEIVLKACEFLDVEPKDVVLVGDTNSDIQAGKAAGCTVIGVNIGADYTVKDISELTRLIEE
jgi:HAD superfamily hydrolase (TIGR01509 family)